VPFRCFDVATQYLEEIFQHLKQKQKSKKKKKKKKPEKVEKKY